MLDGGGKSHTITETTGTPQPPGSDESSVQHRAKLARKLGAEPVDGTPAAVHTTPGSSAKVAPAQEVLSSPAQAAAADTSQRRTLGGKCFGAA